MSDLYCSPQFGRRGLVYVGVCLLAALLICVVAGAVGPNVLRVQSGGTEELVVNKYGETKLLLDVSGFSSMSQFYWIEVEFTPTSDVRYEEINSIDIRLNVTGAGPLVLFRGDHHVVMDKQFSRDVTCRSSSCDKFFLFGQRQIFFESLTSKCRARLTGMLNAPLRSVDMVFTDPDSTFLEGNKLIVSVDVVTISPEVGPPGRPPHSPH